MEPTTTTNASGKIITALIIGLIVGFASGVFWQDRRSGSGGKLDTANQAIDTSDGKESLAVVGVASDAITKLEKTDGTTNTTSNERVEIAQVKGLSVKDQTAGGEVGVDSIDVKGIVWVAVREMKDGKPGNILGARKISSGDAQKVSVELLRSTVAGGTYEVVVYRDVGASDFNAREDVLVEGVQATFSVK